MTTTRESPADRFFDALLDRQEAVFDGIKNANDRYNRFLRSLVEGARQGTRDWADVGRTWAKRPTDVMAVYEAMSEAVGNSQARALALSREWLDDLVEGQRESREVVRRGIGDVREAVERVQANAPTFLRRTASAVRRNDKQPEPEPVGEA